MSLFEIMDPSSGNQSWKSFFVNDLSIANDLVIKNNLDVCGNLTVVGNISGNLVNNKIAFTPVPKIAGSATNITGTFTGHYTKIGQLVTFSLKVALTNKGLNVGVFIIDGLPFTQVNDCVYSVLTQNVTRTQQLVAYSNPSTTQIFIDALSNTTSTAVSSSDMTNTSVFVISGSYFTT